MHCSDQNMKELFAPIKRVFGRRNYFIIFVASGLFYGVIFSMMTNLIDMRFGLANIRFAFTSQSLLFFIILSFLGGLLISLQVFSFREKRKNYISTTTGVSGMLVSFLRCRILSRRSSKSRGPEKPTLCDV